MWVEGSNPLLECAGAQPQAFSFLAAKRMILQTKTVNPPGMKNRRNEIKAIQFDGYGDPLDVLKIRDLPLPEPGEGEGRVRMQLSPINPSDLLFVRGLYPGVQPSFPASVGFEGA